MGDDFKSKPTARLAQWVRYGERLSSTVYVWWVISLCCAGICAWVYRHSMNPDGMGYLDMAYESLRSGPSNLVNGYWSPLYPAFIGLVLSIVRPSLSFSFPVVHVTNFLVFSLALTCFTFFLRSWLAIKQSGTAAKHEKVAYVIPFCYGIFLWFTMGFVRPSLETPDMCVTALVLLAGGICCRLYHWDSRQRSFLALGAVLGTAYYAKAVMLPTAVMLLAVLFIFPPPGKHRRLGVILAGLAFVFVATPLIVVVSKRVGHLSSGETGPINYAFYVNGLPGPPSWRPGSVNGTPEHPPRTILLKPLLIEFATPMKGTNPLQYDPSYWFAGAKVRFDLRQQFAALKTNLRFYVGFCSGMVGLFCGALILCIFNLHKELFYRPDNTLWWFILWPATTFVMYALVHVEARFLTAFFILFWIAVYDFLCKRVDRSVKAAVLGTVLFVLLVPTGAKLLETSIDAIKEVTSAPDYILVGEALRDAGIRPGDSIAVAGGTRYESGGRVYRSSSAFTAYYAHYIGARVVAAFVDADDGKDMPERPDPEFWHVSTEDFVRAQNVLASIGVKAIVALDRPADSTPADWRPVVGTHYSLLLVRVSDFAKN